MPRSIPVSYTHLDVYKRQTYIDLFLYNSGEDKKILVDDIMYIRRESRKIILHTKDGNEMCIRDRVKK